MIPHRWAKSIRVCNLEILKYVLGSVQILQELILSFLCFKSVMIFWMRRKSLSFCHETEVRCKSGADALL